MDGNELRQWVIDWVAALRSGKYKQGKAKLRQGDSYCCLGVLCKTQGLNGVKGIDDVYRFRSGESCVDNVLPIELVEELGISEGGGFDNEVIKVGAKALWELNDNYVSFERIADIIEEIERADAWKK